MADRETKGRGGDIAVVGWARTPMVRRSVMATDANGNVFVYAITDAGLRSANLSNLGAPLATVRFDLTQP